MYINTVRIHWKHLLNFVKCLSLLIRLTVSNGIILFEQNFIYNHLYPLKDGIQHRRKRFKH